MKELQPQTLQVYPVQCVPEGDEISLVDVWLTFRRHGKAFLRTLAGVTLLGLLVILPLPKRYGLKTSVEIGTAIRNGAAVPIESPETVKAKLENSYIPRVINHLTEGQGDIERHEVAVRIPKKSSLVVLDSNIKESEEERYTQFHEQIVAAIVSDHRRLIDVLKKKIETKLELARIKLADLSDPATIKALVNEQKKELEEARSELGKLTDPAIFGTRLKKQENVIQAAQNQLDSLKDARKVLREKLERINSQKQLVKNEIDSLQKRIDQSLSLQLQSAQVAGDASSAMSQLLIDSQITEDRKWLAKLKEQLHITLENDKAEAEKALKDNARNQELAQARIDQAKGVLTELVSINQLEQTALKARIEEIQANIQKLINDQERKIQEQKQTVSELLAQLDNFIQTRAVVPPTRSPRPTSISRKIQLSLVIFLGLIMGTIAVFIAELRDKVHSLESRSAS